MKNMNNYQKGQSNPQMNNMMMPNNFAMNNMNQINFMNNQNHMKMMNRMNNQNHMKMMNRMNNQNPWNMINNGQQGNNFHNNMMYNNMVNNNNIQPMMNKNMNNQNNIINMPMIQNSNMNINMKINKHMNNNINMNNIKNNMMNNNMKMTNNYNMNNNMIFNNNIINNNKVINKNIINNNKNIPNLNMKKSELFGANKFVPIDITNMVLKSVCKIIIKKNGGYYFGTGFFMKINDSSSKYLLTNYHVISEKSINEYIEIEIYNGNKMNLNLNNRYIEYDSNYIKKGYNIYKNSDVFSVEYPYGESAVSGCGKIINIINEYEFGHNIPTDNGSSGCPVILLNKNINLCLVIGIHKEADFRKKLNCGTFIGEIFKDINNNNNLNNNNLNNNNNYIIAKIKVDDINKNYQILSSYEEYIRNKVYKTMEEELKNEEEIKQCEIRINNELIPFNYYYKFKNKGKYQ